MKIKNLIYLNYLQLINIKTGVRNYSSDKSGLSGDFLEWFKGFTDAEGCFYIKHSRATQFSFSLFIVLHIDDKKVLEYIRDTLNMGTVVVSGNKVIFTIVKQEDINKIINIFTISPLNSIKHLNFLAFKKAFELYINSKDKSIVFQEILDIKNSMNKNLSNVDTLKREINITPGWLLGFSEGDGCFSVSICNSKTKNKEVKISFILGQKDIDILLIESIQEYFYKLCGIKFNIIDRKDNYFYLKISNKVFIKALISIFQPLEWHTKKELDFQDWVLIFNLREEGFHLTEEGLRIISELRSQINNFRLSTNKTPEKVDRCQLIKEANELLNGPSNYEYIDGKIFVKSLNIFIGQTAGNILELQDENGNTIKTFKSGVECANFLNLSTTTVYSRLQSQKFVIYQDKNYIIKKK